MCTHVTNCPVFVKVQSHHSCPERYSLNSESAIIMQITLDNYKRLLITTSFKSNFRYSFLKKMPSGKKKKKRKYGNWN